MKYYVLRTEFVWDEGNDVNDIVVTVPNNLTLENINKIIQDTHDKLCFDEDLEGYYSRRGRNIDTLMDFIAEELGWKWERISYDVTIYLD